MNPKNFKRTSVVRKALSKANGVVKLYDKIQIAYATILENDSEIAKIECNVLLEDLPEGEFTTDFLCQKTNGDYCVRECVFRKKLSLPRTCKLLDASRNYWHKRGIDDWAIVIEKEAANEEK